MAAVVTIAHCFPPLSTLHLQIKILVLKWEILKVGVKQGCQIAQLKAHPHMALPNNQIFPKYRV